MHGSDGGMVTYLDEAISKAVQCEISPKASGFSLLVLSSWRERDRDKRQTVRYWYRTPTEPVQLRDSLPLGSGPGALPTLVHAPRRLLALVRLCLIHHDLGSSINLFSVYVVDELLLSICTCEREGRWRWDKRAECLKHLVNEEKGSTGLRVHMGALLGLEFDSGLVPGIGIRFGDSAVTVRTGQDEARRDKKR
ncbi:uncharacterized protein FFB14_00394 [Fusarium fujikuroi]|nr:uncharacterized protein FFB14_00394 [Fusarium fujikuroi]